MTLAGVSYNFFDDLQPKAIFVPLLSLLILSIWFLHSYIRLHHIPGPFFASLTNLSRVSWILSNRAHDIHVNLHKKYGRLVRFGPNMVSVGDPAEIPNIYSFTGKFAKSDFYHVLLFYAKGKPVPTIFATQDEHLHRMLKKPIADSTMRVFSDQLDKLFVQTGDVCDLSKWLQMFAFDVMGEITFSQRLGFLEKAEDVDGVMESIWRYFWKASPISQIPWVDWLWTKNPVLQRLRPVRMNPIVGFGLARIQERQLDSGNGRDDKPSANRRDFLSRFLEARAKDSSIPPWAITAWITSNITAGSDTTAILLRTAIHSLLSQPSTLDRLLAELSTLPPTNEPVSWKAAHDLPYLDACIKEAGRLHPPFGLPFERLVPAEGATICGQNFRAGTVVGMSAWVVHRDREVFGEDSEAWRPERWLCGEEKRRKMEASLLTFGAGHRSCLGKNISYLEVYKLIPTLLRMYDITFADPDCNKWRVENRWFVNQTGLNVRLKRRGR